MREWRSIEVKALIIPKQVQASIGYSTSLHSMKCPQQLLLVHCVLVSADEGVKLTGGGAKAGKHRAGAERADKAQGMLGWLAAKYNQTRRAVRGLMNRTLKVGHACTASSNKAGCPPAGVA